MEDTIAAISTPFGEGAIALIRMSGSRAVEITAAIFRSARAPGELPSRVQHFGRIMDGDAKLDEVLLTIHRAPKSYTGEDVVEIGCHGGVLVTRRILELLLRHGAQPAGPGEFTQRAFLNGKMDLTQAEAVMDLISAQTDLALRAANEQLEGTLGRHALEMRERTLELLAHVEAYIDFPDEDIDPDTGTALLSRIDTIRTELRALLATADRGRVLREGLRTVIFGAPNVGKSSLLNLLLGYERAIVSATPGTTRDSIEEVIDLRGLPLRLIDTAGIRDSRDEIEREGISRTFRQVEKADLILHVFDATQPVPPVASATDAHGASEIRILNKTDLGEDPSWSGQDGVRLSCTTSAGVRELEEAIAQSAFGGSTARRDWSMAINVRHRDCLRQALTYADAARAGIAEGTSPELIAEELRAAMNAIGDVVGRVDSEDLLGKIFASFCIGK